MRNISSLYKSDLNMAKTCISLSTEQLYAGEILIITENRNGKPAAGRA